MASARNSFTKRGIPTPKQMLDAQNEFVEIQKKHRVDIIWADVIPNAEFQVFVRDPFMVINDKLVLNYMHEKARSNELQSVNPLLERIDPANTIYVPNDAIIEGGDIIPHNNKLFVGQDGLRTDKAGLEFLKRTFGDKFDIIPIYMHKTRATIKPLRHLDCTMNPVWEDTVILYPEGIQDRSLHDIENIFTNIISVSKQEQNELGTNVFSIGNKTIVSQKRQEDVISKLKGLGFSIELMSSYAPADLEGYVRCMTCPLVRKK
jgi:N-dimethylarginine dimethylaminohydrolase